MNKQWPSILSVLRGALLLLTFHLPLLFATTARAEDEPAGGEAVEGAAAAAADETPAEPPDCIPTADRRCQYSVTLKRLPPSRVWCTFKNDSGRTQQVVFDPLRGAAGLSNEVTLEGANWKIQCVSEPAPQQLKVGDVTGSLDVGWVFNKEEPLVTAGDLLHAIKAKAPQVKLEQPKDKWTVNMAPPEEALLQIQSVRPPTMKQAFSDLATSTSGAVDKRGLEGDISALAKDTLELLAEIALERAKKKGARLVQAQLQKLVCEELKGNSAWGLDLVDEDLLFPRLCAAIRDLPLPELIESAAKVGRALEMDIAQLGFKFAESKIDSVLSNQASKEVVEIVLKHIQAGTLHLIENREFTSEDAELLVMKMGQDVLANAQVSCEVKVTFAVAASCYQKPDGCNAGEILVMLRQPGSFFEDGTCAAVQEWEQAANVVSRIVEVLRPPQGAKPRDRYRTAVVLAFDLAQHGVRASKPAAGATPEVLKKWSLANALLIQSRELTLGVFDQEARTIVTSGLEILRTALAPHLEEKDEMDKQEKKDRKAAEKVWAAIDRLTPVVVALTSNAETLQKAKKAESEEEREALREARKETLEALIDSATQRSHRGREWVASLGANVGFRYGAGFTPTVSNGKASQEPNLSLPMGIAVQYLAPSQKLGFGWHFQGSFFDLAQFLDTTKDETIEWNDFVLIGLQAGPILGDADNAFSFAVDVRYFPSGRLRDTWFVGGAISYYVPFFDLN